MVILRGYRSKDAASQASSRQRGPSSPYVQSRVRSPAPSGAQASRLIRSAPGAARQALGRRAQNSRPADQERVPMIFYHSLASDTVRPTVVLPRHDRLPLDTGGPG
jgi:hypothetical protein